MNKKKMIEIEIVFIPYSELPLEERLWRKRMEKKWKKDGTWID